MSDFFNLVEHRKLIQGRTLRLSEDLVVIPMDQSNEDELANQLRNLEAQKMARRVNKLLEEASEAGENDRDEEATLKVTEATKLAQAGLTMMLETLRTMVCTDEGKKTTLAQLRKAIGSQDEASAVIDAVAAAREVDPPKRALAGSTPT